MDFIIICIVSLVALGVVAAIASMMTKGGTDAPIVGAECGDCMQAELCGDEKTGGSRTARQYGSACQTCGSALSGECRIGSLIEEKKRQKGNKSDEKEL